MKKLSVLDLAFFLVESEGSPKHVAGLLLFKKPSKCPSAFVSQLVEELKTYDELTESRAADLQFISNFTMSMPMV